MRKILFAFIMTLAASTAASAQWNGPPPAAPGGCGTGGCASGGGGGGAYGWNHNIRKCFFWCKKGSAAPAPVQTPGTLVFPQHQFVRSPRDYFMWEGNK